jgi:small nuclear ribonucleoprotein (snRNP)-like protein
MKLYITMNYECTVTLLTSCSLACFQIQVKDGRVLVGEFVCLDKQGNIILDQAHEEILVDGR